MCSTLWPHGACQAPLSIGFPRQEKWNGLPFPSPGVLPNPRIEPTSPELQADYHWATREDHKSKRTLSSTLPAIMLNINGLNINQKQRLSELIKKKHRFQPHSVYKRNYLLSHTVACRSLVPDHGLNLGPQQWNQKVLTIGPTKNSQETQFRLKETNR